MIAYELHREAEGDLFAAAEYYEDRVPGLGLDLVSEFERAVAGVLELPLASPLWPDIPSRFGVRRKLLRRFPYGLPYVGSADRVVVLAVAHLRREPGHWLGRARAYLR